MIEGELENGYSATKCITENMEFYGNSNNAFALFGKLAPYSKQKRG